MIFPARLTPEATVTASPVELLHLGFRRSLAGLAAAPAFLVAALWSIEETVTLIGWVAAMWVVLAIRAYVDDRFARIPHDGDEDARYTDHFTIGAAVTGALWGLTAFLFIESPDDPALALVGILLCCVTGMVHFLHAPAIRTAAAYLTTALLPLTLRLGLFGDPRSLFLSAAVALYLATMLSAAWRRCRFIRRARTVALLSGKAEEERRRRDEARLRLFERLLGGAGLAELLAQVVHYVESARPDLLCAILQVDADRRHLRVGATSTLPAAFVAAMDGAEIAEGRCTCATAAWRGEAVFVEDVDLDPCWIELRVAAAAAGLRSCWSFPVGNNEANVLGTLAIYRRTPGLPDETELTLIREARHLATVVIAHCGAVDRLRAREREFRTLVEHSPDTIARYDSGCRRTYANPNFVRSAGVSVTELLGKMPTEFPGGDSAAHYQAEIAEVLATGKARDFELRWTSAAGDEHYTHVRLEPECDANGLPTHVLAVGRDVSRLVEYQGKLRQLAYADSLTGLPNRAMLRSFLDEAFYEAARSGEPAALAVVGLDGFKTINDTFGRQAGDQLLRATSDRLQACVAAANVLARLEGDEFAILFPTLPPDSGESAVAAMLASFVQPFQLGSMEVRLTASLGIALHPAHGADAEELLRCAALALRQAKRDGRNCARRYIPELTAIAQERLALEADLRKGIAEDAFVLYYQPKIDLTTGATVGAEALLRWRHPERGLLTPDRFIGLAEETGAISEIGKWVLLTACRAARRWNETGRSCRIAVNLSARQFSGGSLTDTVQEALAITGCRPQWLELEITESLLLDDLPEIRTTLETLTGMGIRLAIDDFGTGYSALGYLTRFPIDTLKIDRSFVAGAVTDPQSAALVTAIASMAHSLELEIVAEGVEALDQADFLRDLGCEQAQGYLYGRPMPAEMFEAMFESTASALEA